jgi:hypothetical protein
MSYPDLLVKLQELSKMKENWYSVSEITEQIKHAGGTELHPSLRFKEAAEASGFSTNTLNRMLAVRGFLDSVKDETPELQAGIDPNSISFPSLEVVKRLYQVNHEEGRRLLAEVVRGEITYRELRKQYNKLIAENVGVASSHQIARIAGRDFENAALAALHSSEDEFFKDLKITTEVPKSLPLQIDAVGYQEDADGHSVPLIGFEFKAYREQSNWKQILELLVYRAQFAANFFQCFWVVFSSSVGVDRIEIFSRIFDELGCPSIGVAVLIMDSEQLEIVRQPKDNPLQDWSEKVEKFGKLRDQLLGKRSFR